MINRASSLHPIYACTPHRHSTPLEVCHRCGSPNTWVTRWLDQVIPELDDAGFRAAWALATGVDLDDEESDDPEEGPAAA